MKLYSGPLSLFSAKVRIALDENAIDYELIDVPWGVKEGYSPRHPMVELHNPKRQVPVLADGDLVLYDSTVILKYLEEIVPEPALFPSDRVARARCRLLELESDEIHFAPVRDLIGVSFYPRARGEEPDAEPRAPTWIPFDTRSRTPARSHPPRAEIDCAGPSGSHRLEESRIRRPRHFRIA
jgi:glutathione S-transferase